MKDYSASRLDTFEQCPLKFRYEYIDKREAELGESVEAFLGSRVHEALYKLYRDLKFQKLLTLPQLLEYFNAEWEKNWNDGILIVRKEYDKENFRKMGEKFLSDYYARYAPFNQSRTIALETRRRVALDSRFSIHIRIDRLEYLGNGVYEIHDYKTNSSLPTQQELDEDRQLAIYAYGVSKWYPDASRIRLVWHFLAFDREMSSERSRAQLEKLRREVLELIERIESEKEFPAKKSALCSWCQFQPVCPEWGHILRTSQLPVNEFLNEPGVKLVNEYASTAEQIEHLQERLEKIRAALVEYAKREGVTLVSGSDVLASVKSYVKQGFPKRGEEEQTEFFEMLKRLGLWERLAVPDVYELARMINSGELPQELTALLEPFIRREEQWRIYLKRKR